MQSIGTQNMTPTIRALLMGEFDALGLLGGDIDIVERALGGGGTEPQMEAFVVDHELGASRISSIASVLEKQISRVMMQRGALINACRQTGDPEVSRVPESESFQDATLFIGPVVRALKILSSQPSAVWAGAPGQDGGTDPGVLISAQAAGNHLQDAQRLLCHDSEEYVGLLNNPIGVSLLHGGDLKAQLDLLTQELAAWLTAQNA